MIRKSHLLQQLKHDIENQVYIVGEKMPSVRDLCIRFGCSHMTAYNALLDLASEGYIETRPRSGHYVAAREGQTLISFQEPSMANLLSHLISTEVHKNILPLGTAAQLDMLLPVKEFIDSIPFKSRESFYRTNFSHYSYPPGDLDLRRSIAKHLQLRQIKRLAEEIILTNGATESLFLSLKLLTSPGDKVIISSPCFFGTINILEQLKLKIIEIPSIKERGIDIHAIKTALGQHPDIKLGIFQPNYDSPTGSLSSDQIKEGLVKLFKSKSLYLIEDDTYGDLSFEIENLSNLKSYDNQNTTVFSCGSFSKSLGTGLRVGWLIPPSNFIERVIKLKLAANYSGSTFNEKILMLYLKKNRVYEKHLKKLRKVLRENIAQARELCLAHMPPNSFISNPKGGYCLWVEFPETLDTFLLYKKLIQQNIAISPGHIFSTKNVYKNCIRINCAIDIDDRMKKAIRIIGKTANELLEN